MNGYFRRLLIVKFDNHFTNEQRMKFNFNNLVTEEALDYLANIALRKYLKMMSENNGIFSNIEESEKIINIYKISDNSILGYLEDQDELNKFLTFNNEFRKSVLFDNYKEWCEENGLKSKPKSELYNVAIDSGKFINISKKNGYDYMKYVSDGCKSFNEINIINRKRTFEVF